MDVVNRHAPVRHKWVKHPKPPLWLNKKISQAFFSRDWLKKERMFTEYETERSKVKTKKTKNNNNNNNNNNNQKCKEIIFE